MDSLTISPARRWLSFGLLALAFVLLYLDLFSLWIVPVAPPLHLSWSAALVHFSAQKLQFGKDVIFTYGPLAHLVSFAYTGELFGARLIAEYAGKAVLAGIFCVTIVALPRLWRLPFFLFVFLFIWLEPIPDALYFLAMTCLTALLFRHGLSRPSLNAVVALFLAVCSLIKFTYLVLVLFTLVMLAAYYLSQKGGRASAVTLVVTFLGSLALCWTLAGQALTSFVPYLTSSFEISVGYKDAMGFPATTNWIVAAGLIAVFLACSQGALPLLNGLRLPLVFVALYYAGENFLSWNRAFVRADEHVLSFFGLCPAALMTLWIAAKPTESVRRVGHAVNWLVLLVCVFGMYLQRHDVVTRSVPDAIARISFACRQLFAGESAKTVLDRELLKSKELYGLPRVQAAVGRETVDVFGYEQGTALLNDLNYKARPIFQGYSSYTPKLIAANTAHYSGPRAPAFVLFKYQPIDERYPPLEDAGVLRSLLLNYSPLFEEQGYRLWKRVAEPRPISPAFQTPQTLGIDEWCTLPNEENLWMELQMPLSWRGRLLSFFYKPPQVELHVNDSQGHRSVYRFIPSMSAAGFIINPKLETERDVLLASAGLPGTSVSSFTVHVPREARRYFQRRLTYKLAPLPAIPSVSMDRPSRVARYTELFGKEGPVLELVDAFRSSTAVLQREEVGAINGFSVVRDAQLTPSAIGLEVRAEGDDPQLRFPPITVAKGEHAIVRLELETTLEYGLELEYVSPVKSGAPMKRCLTRKKDVVYFELDAEQLVAGALHLDPGDYLITGFEARSVAAP